MYDASALAAVNKKRLQTNIVPEWRSWDGPHVAGINFGESLPYRLVERPVIRNRFDRNVRADVPSQSLLVLDFYDINCLRKCI